MKVLLFLPFFCQATVRASKPSKQCWCSKAWPWHSLWKNRFLFATVFCGDQEQHLESRQIHCESCWTKKAMISVMHHDQTMLVEPFCCEGIFPPIKKTQNKTRSGVFFYIFAKASSELHSQPITPTTPHLFRKISSTPALVISSARLWSFISFASRAHETKRCNLSKLAFCKPTVWAVSLDLG